MPAADDLIGKVEPHPVKHPEFVGVGRKIHRPDGLISLSHQDELWFSPHESTDKKKKGVKRNGGPGPKPPGPSPNPGDTLSYWVGPGIFSG